MSIDIKYPNDDEIEQDFARFLYEEHCAIFILEDLPVGSVIGIDLNTFQIGEKFRGIKLIPPGLHFVFVGSVDKTGRQYGTRCGFYHLFKEKEVYVKRWSPANEDYDDAFQIDEEQLERYSTNLRDLDQHLGPYRYSTYKSYLSLTDRLNTELLNDIAPKGWRIYSASGTIDDDIAASVRASETCEEQTPQSLIDKVQDDEILPSLELPKDSKMRFTTIPDHRTFSNISPEDITQYILDTSTKLEQIFGRGPGLSRLLGELQFAFLTVLLGHVYDCFEHWQRLLDLVCRAESALTENTQFFLDFSKILEAQLYCVPRDLFDDVWDQENRLRFNLDIFFQNVSQMDSHSNINASQLIDQTKSLRTMLEEKFEWQFDLEADDERPIVVDM